MTATRLEVRLEQFIEPVGYLNSTSEGGTSYSYSEQYLGHPNKVPLSIALPLKPEQFDDIETRAFFDNLLPENDQLQQVMEREGLARTDTVGLLSHLGADCPGAISCVPDGEGPVKVPGVIPNDYDILRDEEIKDIVRRLADREPLPNVMRDPSPLAGVQRKIAFTQFQDGRFGVPKLGLRVPTTHILKVPRRTKGREALLETAAAMLCRAAALDVVIPTVLNIDGLAALLVPRFDREIGADGTVRRIHQEDFAQALGLPARLKYERYGRDDRRFDVSNIVKLLDLTAAPAAAKHDFLVATIFNLVIGNSDNHAKNHALLYDEGSVPRLAPLYDLLPTRLDNTLTEDFSFKIGNAERSNSLTQVDIMSFLSSFGLSKAAAERFISDTIAPLLGQIDMASESLTAQGLKDFDDLIGSEAQRLIEVLRLKVSIRNRDYFTRAKSGGWKLGS